MLYIVNNFEVQTSAFFPQYVIYLIVWTGAAEMQCFIFFAKPEFDYDDSQSDNLK